MFTRIEVLESGNVRLEKHLDVVMERVAVSQVKGGSVELLERKQPDVLFVVVFWPLMKPKGGEVLGEFERLEAAIPVYLAEVLGREVWMGDVPRGTSGSPGLRGI